MDNGFEGRPGNICTAAGFASCFISSITVKWV